MKPWMAALLGATRQQFTQTFTANATWVAPWSTSALDASGNGAAGTPGQAAYDDPSTQRKFRITSNYYRRTDGGPDDVESSTIYGEAAWSGTVQPANTSETAPYENPPYYELTQIIQYGSETIPGAHHDAIAPTTGAATTAFSRTFPGGTGGAATITSFSNVAVTPGAPYSIVVPAGGSLTITYYK